jgi:CheY-like chemotaxis protein
MKLPEDGPGDQPTAGTQSNNILTQMRHELRTPLNAMIGYGEMLFEDATDLGLKTLTPDLQNVIVYSRELLALINEILSPSRIEPPDAAIDVDQLAYEIRDKLQVPLNGALVCTQRLIQEAEQLNLERFVADLSKIAVAGHKLRTFISEMTTPLKAETPPVSTPQAAPAARQFSAGSLTEINSDNRRTIIGQNPIASSLLIVDDNEMNRDVLSRYLERQGYTVAAAASGREALQMLQGQPFNLVLLDIMMPEMNGYEVLQHMKANVKLWDIPVIFISAIDDTDGKVKAFKAGGVDYITKPFQAEEVVARVENQLKISRLQAALERRNQELMQRNEELIRAQQRTNIVFSALADVLPGSVLDGKYRLEQKIGAGGFGAVYRATHVGLSKPVAVKLFRPLPGNASPEGLERFYQEGVSASRVTHRNAVAVLDSGISSGLAYLVMELLSGHSLAEELTQQNILSTSRALAILIPVCEALAAAHERGIVHRDIKPDNIFLHQTRDGEVVKVVDFGIAKIVKSTGGLPDQTMTSAGDIVGTPAYIAPERFADQPYDGRADIYSVGILLYRMLSGNVPFQSSDGGLYSIALMHLTKEPKLLRSLNPMVPVTIENLVSQMLSKDPDKRPTASELVQQVRALAGIEAAQKPVGMPD